MLHVIDTLNHVSTQVPIQVILPRCNIQDILVHKGKSAICFGVDGTECFSYSCARVFDLNISNHG